MEQRNVNWQVGMQNAWNDVARFIPNFLAFLLILIIGYVVAKVVATIIDKGLQKAGFDRVVERGGITRLLQNSGLKVSDLVGKIVFYALFLFVLQMAFAVFGPNPVSALLTRLIAFLPNIFVALLIVVIAASVASVVRDIVVAALGGLSYGRTLANVAAAAIIVIGVFAALDQLHIAPAITIGLFYAMLAIVVGSSIVAIGGGGIQPMRRVWERTMNRVEEEAPRIIAEAEGRPVDTARPVVTDPTPEARPVTDELPPDDPDFGYRA
jgi:hypothetical protein